MSFGESVYTAMFTLAIVFFALFALYLCIRLFSAAFIRVEKARKEADSAS